MRTLKLYSTSSVLLAVGLAMGVMVGCSNTTKTPDVTGDLRASLDRAGLKDISVSQDRDKGVVTLGGHVPYDSDKVQAESIARSVAGAQVVANQIAVVPPGVEKEAKTVNSELDKGIEHNVEATLTAERLSDDVKYSVKNHVVTLTGNVDSEAKRTHAQKVVAAVPNVDQVVNELQVKDQKATASH